MSIFKVEDFGPFTLSVGSHDGPSEGMCIMEMVSFLAGEEWSDFPECACPVLGWYCQTVNDNAPPNIRDELQTLAPLLIGTRSADHEQARAEVLAWATTREFVPYAFRVLGAHNIAENVAAGQALPNALELFPDVKMPPDCEAGWAVLAAQSSITAAIDGRTAHASSMSGQCLKYSDAWGLAIPVLRRAIEAGPHGETLEPIHTERASILKAKMEAAQ